MVFFFIFSETDLTPEDPEWVGAWWIGFILLALIMLIWAVPTVLFPARLPGQPSLQKEEKGFKDMAKGTDLTIFFLSNVALAQLLIADLRCFTLFLMLFVFILDLPVAILRLLKNPVYVCLACGLSFDIFTMGFYTFFPKYIQVYFGLSPSMASIVAGISIEEY